MQDPTVHETMTVHQALCELKTLNKRIYDAIEKARPVSVKEHSSQKVDGMELSEFKTIAQSTNDSAFALIKRRRAIKDAINQYNASTVITVGGKNYTIAQAIWENSYGIVDDRSMLTRYTKALRDAQNKIERANGDDLNRRAEAAMNAIFGGKDKNNASEYLAGVEDYKAKHAMELVDPLGIRKIIEDLDQSTAEFDANMDAAIQVANATNTIEIVY